MKNVEVLRLARIEVLEATEYFDQFSDELGDALVDEFQHVLEQISQYPLSVPVVQEPIRKRPMFRFPYNVFYRISGNEIQVLAFVHQKRGPVHLSERLGTSE